MTSIFVIIVRDQTSNQTKEQCSCPHCGHSLVHKKDRKHFVIHKCINPKCPDYLHNLNKVDSKDLKDLYNISISHQQVANYCKTAALCVKLFVDNCDYKADKIFTADETYIKIRGVKAYIRFIMDAAKRSIIGQLPIIQQTDSTVSMEPIII